MKNLGETKVRDLIVFEVLTALIATHTLLISVNTGEFVQTLFYLILLVMNLVCLLWLRLYYAEKNQLVDYDENLTQESILWILAGVLGVYFTAVFIQNLVSSSIYIPKVVSLSVGGINLGEIASITIYNLCLVANSEELTKLIAHQTIYMWLREKTRGKGGEVKYESWIQGISVIIPIGFWATLHAYVAYTGQIMPVLVISAFFGGLVIFAVLWKTKSLFAAILCHGFYNVAVLVATSLGVIGFRIPPTLLIATSTFNLVLLVLLRWRAR